MTLHWGQENAREVINEFVDEINTKLTRKNRLTKDFVMKACLVLLNLPVAYRVSSFTKETCARIKDRWDEIRSATRRAVDAANAFGIDENNLTSHNALIPVALYLYQHPKLTLRGESATEVESASRVRVWLISALLNKTLGGSSDAMLTRLREALMGHFKPNGDFPFGALNDAVKDSGRTSTSSADAVENVMSTTYGDDTCFLALSLLFKDRNWGTIKFSIDHLFAQDDFKGTVPTRLKELKDDFANLTLIIADENSGKGKCPLHEWLGTRSKEFLGRHFIPEDAALWHISRYEEFLIERRKLMKVQIQNVLGVTP